MVKAWVVRTAAKSIEFHELGSILLANMFALANGYFFASFVPSRSVLADTNTYTLAPKTNPASSKSKRSLYDKRHTPWSIDASGGGQQAPFSAEMASKGRTVGVRGRGTITASGPRAKGRGQMSGGRRRGGQQGHRERGRGRHKDHPRQP